MKKRTSNFGKLSAGALAIAGIVCSIAWLRPLSTGIDGGAVQASKTAKPVAAPARKVAAEGTTELVKRLMDDHLISEVAGFVVETKDNKLYINGKLQPAEVSSKYLPVASRMPIRVQVLSFIERMKMHPDANMLQLLTPVSTSSGCVAISDSKSGC